MYKKACSTCKLVVLLNNPIVFFDVLSAVAVVFAKAPYFNFRWTLRHFRLCFCLVSIDR